jgi:hypothetical protein
MKYSLLVNGRPLARTERGKVIEYEFDSADEAWAAALHCYPDQYRFGTAEFKVIEKADDLETAQDKFNAQ